MATNLVSLVMQFLTPDLIGRIASTLGINRNVAQTAVSAAVPALLAGLVGTVSKPGGAQKLVDAVKQEAGMLDGIAGMFGQGQASSLSSQGSSLLSSLLGGNIQSALVGAVTKFAGMDEGKGSSLLGMLTPVVLGVIGKEAGGGGRLNASSLSDLLNSQKGNIAQAMPSGFGDLLGRSGLLDSLSTVGSTTTSATRAATSAADHVGRTASSSAHVVGNTGERANSAFPRWAYWAVPLAAVLGISWYMLGNRAPHTVDTMPTASVVIGDTDVGKLVGDNLGELTTSLESVTDTASANAALPKLQQVETQLDRATSALAQASADQKRILKGLVDPAMATLNPLFDKVLAIPGVGDVLRPTVDALKAKIAALA